MRPIGFAPRAFALALLLAAPLVAQGVVAPPPLVDCAAFPCVHAPDGAEELQAKTDVYLWVGSAREEHVLAAVLISPAAFVGDFQPLVDGVLFVAPIKGGGALYETYFVPPELLGWMISLKAYATDGLTLDEGPVVTCRIVTS